MDNCFNKDVLSDIGEEKLNLLKKISREISGKSPLEALMIIEREKECFLGESFSDEERKLLMESAILSLPDPERQQIKYILGIV